MPCISFSFSFKKPLPWISILVSLAVARFFLGFGFSSVTLTSVLTLSTLIFYSVKPQQKPKTTEGTAEERAVSTEEVTLEKPEDYLSEGECAGRSSTSEDSEAENIFRDNSDEDGSISDEDSLIEIELLSGVYIDQKCKEEEKKKKKKKKKKLGDDLELWKQQISLAELLAEFNEEENLIEIDLSIGSIKCAPRFEIPA